jgi:hypothetical protein
MTINEQLIQLMQEAGMDTRPDPKLNHDADQIAEMLGVSMRTVISWLSPVSWVSHRKMRSSYLDLLQIKLNK